MITITNKTYKTKSAMFVGKYMTKSAFVILYLFTIGFNATAQEGQIVRETVYTPSLEGNLLGDSPNRQVNIYLPPSYETEPGRYYPVVYMLHGFTGDHNYWTGTHGNILSAMKSWLEQSKAKEMILVMPNSYNKFRGSFYTNTSTGGNWADYIAIDVVEYIDSHYRTLPYRGSRAVVGHSMGGQGAVYIGILYPEVFGCMGGLAGAYLLEGLELQANANFYADVSTVENWNQFYSLGFFHQASFAFSAAFAPNPDRPPFYCDFPYVYTDTEPKEVIKVQEVYDKFLEHDILNLAEKHYDTLLSMRAIYIDCGTNDDLIERARQLHSKLGILGIKHLYKEFLGDHTNRIMTSTGDALELFSSAMEFEMLADEVPTNPIPADGAIYAGNKIEWSPATAAVSHYVYFNDNFDDVNDGTDEAFRGNQIPTYLVVGLPGSPYPDGLVNGTTYYWRVDEVNGTEPYSPCKGPVWSFTVEPDVPVAYWKLDEAEGDIAYDCIGDNLGILTGNPIWQPNSGQVAGGLEFDGFDDYITTDFVLDPSLGTFTVLAWVKNRTPGQVIISQLNGIGTGETWLCTDASNGNLMTGLVPLKIGRYAPQPLVSETVITDGLWHHIGFVWDGLYRVLYVDGVEVAKDNAVQNPLKSATGGLYIGAGKTLSTGTFFSGLIDDVRIYDIALSAEEIADLAQ